MSSGLSCTALFFVASLSPAGEDLSVPSAAAYRQWPLCSTSAFSATPISRVAAAES